MADDTSAVRASPTPAAAGSIPPRHSRGRAADPRLADPRRGRRELNIGRQCRIAVDRRRVRRVADLAGSRGRRLLARARASVFWLGALGDRYGRKSTAPGRPALDSVLPVSGVCTDIEVLIVARIAAASRRHGLSDDARADHGPVVPGPGRTQFDRAVVGPRRRHRGARAPRVGVPARAFRVGVGLPGHPSARGRRPVHGLALRPRHVNETSTRSTTWAGSCRRSSSGH